MNNDPIPSIQSDQLLCILRKALSRAHLEIGEYRLTRLAGGTGEGSQGVYRISGAGRERNRGVSWSLILKILVPPDDLSSAAVHSPAGFAYWKREAEALASGLLDDLPRRLSTPRCYKVTEQVDGSVWLWMEDVGKDPGAWTMRRYAETAHLLGQWQGRYLTGKPLPDAGWLTTRTWNRDFVEENRTTIALLMRSLAKPWVRYVYPAKKLEEMLWIWQEREAFYRILEGLPQVFCHRDVFGRNLMDRLEPKPSEIVLIDWTYAGSGAIGEELVPLVQATYLWGEVERGTYAELEEEVLSGYIAGLKDAGWQGDPRLVRLGYTAASALRYTIGTVRFGFQSLLEESTSPDSPDELSQGSREMYDFWSETMLKYIFPLAHEALMLAEQSA
jgi:hypothetical protein